MEPQLGFPVPTAPLGGGSASFRNMALRFPSPETAVIEPSRGMRAFVIVPIVFLALFWGVSVVVTAVSAFKAGWDG